MARGGSRGGSRSSSFGRSSSRSPPPRQAPTATRPMPTAPTATTTAPQSGSMLGGIGSTIMTGMAFGAGSEIAHQAVRGVIGSGSKESTEHQAPQQQQQQQQQMQPCQNEIYNFSQCISNEANLSYCQGLSDALKSCKQMHNML